MKIEESLIVGFFFCRHKVLKPKLEGKCFKTTYHFFKRADCMRESSVLLLGFISEISFFGHLLCENETRLATLTTSSQVLKQHLGYSIIVLVTNCSQKRTTGILVMFLTNVRHSWRFFSKSSMAFRSLFPSNIRGSQITKKKSFSFTSFCFSLDAEREWLESTPIKINLIDQNEKLTIFQ